jgi:hypothetical protein
MVAVVHAAPGTPGFVETTFSVIADFGRGQRPALPARYARRFRPTHDSRCSTIRSQAVSTIVRYLGQDNQAQTEPDQTTEELHKQLVLSINAPGIRGLPQNEINALRFAADANALDRDEADGRAAGCAGTQCGRGNSTTEFRLPIRNHRNSLNYREKPVKIPEEPTSCRRPGRRLFPQSAPQKCFADIVTDSFSREQQVVVGLAGESVRLLFK